MTRLIDSPFQRNKCKGFDVQKLDSAKYLGVTTEQKLSWNEHIGNVVKKANSSRRSLDVTYKYHSPI